MLRTLSRYLPLRPAVTRAFVLSASGLLMVMVMLSCTQTIHYAAQEPGTGTYLTGMPLGNAGPHLERMQQSVKRITSTSYYDTYIFDRNARITHADIEAADSPEQLAEKVISTNNTSSGSAVIIHNRNNKIALLTTKHTITSPDTLYDYTDATSTFLESMTVKTRQINWLYETPYIGQFDVLLTDSAADLAVIGTEIKPDEIDGTMEELFPVFPHPFGDPNKLKPGTFIYSIGYPRGYPMITSGLTSESNRGMDHSFVIDATFNPGFSGGVVMAINGGIPEFEWMGMARSASAERQWVVKPEADVAQNHSGHLPYDGELFLERLVRINYGITHVVSATRIREMLEEASDELSKKGYRIPF